MPRNLKVCHACKALDYHEQSGGLYPPDYYYINGLVEAELDGKVNTHNSLCEDHKKIYDVAFAAMSTIPIDKETVEVDKNAN